MSEEKKPAEKSKEPVEAEKPTPQAPAVDPKKSAEIRPNLGQKTVEKKAVPPSTAPAQTKKMEETKPHPTTETQKQSASVKAAESKATPTEPKKAENKPAPAAEEKKPDAPAKPTEAKAAPTEPKKPEVKPTPASEAKKPDAPVKPSESKTVPTEPKKAEVKPAPAAEVKKPEPSVKPAESKATPAEPKKPEVKPSPAAETKKPEAQAKASEAKSAPDNEKKPVPIPAEVPKQPEIPVKPAAAADPQKTQGDHDKAGAVGLGLAITQIFADRLDFPDEKAMKSLPVPKENEGFSMRLHPAYFREFLDHPFSINRDVKDYKDLFESIRENGISEPVLARPGKDGGLELISGHRRHDIARQLNYPVPVVIRQIDDDSAQIAVVDGNLHRQDIPTSELARAAKMKMDALAKKQDAAPRWSSLPHRKSAPIRSSARIWA